jgi:hypothetical protein
MYPIFHEEKAEKETRKGEHVHLYGDRGGVPLAAISIDQAARTPAGRSSPEYAVADDAVERHEDDLADEPGDDARALFDLGAGFFDAPPLGVAVEVQRASCAAEMSALMASPAGGSTPAAPTGCSKSVADRTVRVSVAAACARRKKTGVYLCWAGYS